jgi:hypothetical protein
MTIVWKSANAVAVVTAFVPAKRPVAMTRLTPTLAAALETGFAAGVLDEEAAHGLGGGGEELAAAVPVSVGRLADQAQVRLVDQRRGLERLPGCLVPQPVRGQAAQVVVDQLEALGRGVRVAGPCRVQEAD